MTPRLGGWLAVTALAAVVAGAVGFLLSATGSRVEALWSPYLARVLGFTLWQAGLSTLLSLLFAIPVARALSRRSDLPGRRFIIGLFGLPLALPAIVAVFAMLAVWGNRGWLATIAGGEMPSIYGLSGILLTHVFFNMPLTVRLLLSALEWVASEQWRLSEQLGLSSVQVWRLLEWPALRAVLPGAAGLVFMLCLTSFAVVLVLGGGPGATTLEVAIYQSLRFDFDPARAVLLSAVQIGLTVAVLAALALAGLRVREEADLSRAVRPAAEARLLDGCVIVIGTAFVALPLLAVVVDGLGADLARLLGERSVQGALATSVAIAIPSAVLASVAAFALSFAALRTDGMERRVFGAASSVSLVVPPIVLGAGWFIAVNRYGADGPVAKFALVVAANVLIALPFAARVIGPALASLDARTGRLSDQIGLRGLAWLRLVGAPLLARPIGAALAFAFALSLGDLGVIALLGTQDFTTLPLLLMQRLGSYRTDDAAGLALILAALALLAFAAGDFGKRKT